MALAPTFPPIAHATHTVPLAEGLARLTEARVGGLLLELRARAREVTVPRSTGQASAGHQLEAPGSRTTTLYYLVRGTAEQYWESADERRTSYLWTAGDVVCRMRALMAGVPEANGIHVAPDSVLLAWDYPALQACFRENPGNDAGAFGALAFDLMQHYALAIGQLGSVIGLKTPRQRYDALAELRPEWVAAFSQTRIASLLNMRRETLSRLRGRSGA